MHVVNVCLYVKGEIIEPLYCAGVPEKSGVYFLPLQLTLTSHNDHTRSTGMLKQTISINKIILTNTTIQSNWAITLFHPVYRVAREIWAGNLTQSGNPACLSFIVYMCVLYRAVSLFIVHCVYVCVLYRAVSVVRSSGAPGSSADTWWRSSWSEATPWLSSISARVTNFLVSPSIKETSAIKRQGLISPSFV